MICLCDSNTPMTPAAPPGVTSPFSHCSDDCSGCSLNVGGRLHLFVFAETLAPGQVIPWHRHDGCEEVMLVEEGGLTITVGMVRKETGPRSMAFMPQGAWHLITYTSNHPVHVTSVYSGHDFDDSMCAISVAPGEPIVPIDPKKLPRLRVLGHATYWDTKLGPFAPGVAHP